MRILLFGKYGQVAQSLRDEADSRDLVALGSGDCDLMQSGAGAAAIAAHKPEIVINATGFTAVDKAESEISAARRLNAEAPAELAAAAHEASARFIHLSTDYVFDGARELYNENAQTHPLNQYGETKRDGEIAVLAAAPNSIILRTSWVFSPHGANFVKTMLRIAGERQDLTVVGDQIGGPTSAGDIARAILTIAAKIHRGAEGAGIYHFQGCPAVSWAAFARAIFEVAGVDIAVREIATTDYPTPAQRPLRTVLDCARIERDFGVPPPDWRSGLRQTISALTGPPGNH